MICARHVRGFLTALSQRPFANGFVLQSRATETLGDIAEVRTGFYSGNDRRWLRRMNAFVPRSKGYQDIDPEEVFISSNGSRPALEGIDDSRHFIPVMRGGAAALVKPTRWYVNWNTQAVQEFRRRGKNPARFQNSRFYFQQGIGVPMVASARLTAALIHIKVMKPLPMPRGDLYLDDFVS